MEAARQIYAGKDICSAVLTMRQCGARMQRRLPARGGVDWSRFQSRVEYIIYDETRDVSHPF